MSIPLDQMKHLLENSIACVERMGFKALELEPRYTKLSMPLQGNENHFGVMYAGVLFTLGEMCGGALFVSSFDVTKYFPVVKEMNIQYRRPVKTDAFIEMRMSEEEAERIMAEADSNGKADYVLEGEITDTSGEMVALTKGIYQVRSIEKGML